MSMLTASGYNRSATAKWSDGAMAANGRRLGGPARRLAVLDSVGLRPERERLAADRRRRDQLGKRLSALTIEHHRGRRAGLAEAADASGPPTRGPALTPRRVPGGRAVSADVRSGDRCAAMNPRVHVTMIRM